MNKFINLAVQYCSLIFRKKLFIKIKYTICILIFLFFSFKLIKYLHPFPYPFEEGQNDANGLLTDQELRNIFKSHLNENKIKCKNETITLVAVNSATVDFNRRQAIRETWAKQVRDTNQILLFFIAKPKDFNLQKHIELEDYYYEDIVLLPIQESYYLLSFKILSILNWSSKNCPNIKFLIKCDDDMFVNWLDLNKFLIANQNQTNVIFGKKFENPSPIRDITSRWFISYEAYDKDYYPDYADGPMYIVSGDLIPKLLNATSYVKLIYLEDVLITGILREQIKEAKLKNIHNLIGTFLFDSTYCLAHSVYSFHKATTEQMKYLFQNYSFKNKSSSFFCIFFLFR